MPYDFNPREDQLQTAASGRRAGGPPRKYTGVAVMDPPPPPEKLSFLPRLLARLRSFFPR